MTIKFESLTFERELRVEFTDEDEMFCPEDDLHLNKKLADLIGLEPPAHAVEAAKRGKSDKWLDPWKYVTDDDNEQVRITGVFEREVFFIVLSMSHNLAMGKDYDYSAVIRISSEQADAVLRAVDPSHHGHLTDEIRIEADTRRNAGEMKDPLIAVDDALSAGENVPAGERKLILEAHREGPWRIHGKWDIEVYGRWSERCGAPLDESPADRDVYGVPVYTDSFGDCVLVEAGKGHRFAVWTRPSKGRIQIGFRDEPFARAFRSVRSEWSQEATGNKRIGLVVLEGLELESDREVELERVCIALKAMSVAWGRVL